MRKMTLLTVLGSSGFAVVAGQDYGLNASNTHGRDPSQYGGNVEQYYLCHPGYGPLSFNKTNAAMIISKCLAAGPPFSSHQQVSIEDSFEGELDIAGVETIGQIAFEGRYAWHDPYDDSSAMGAWEPLHVSRISIPDLVNASGVFISQVNNLSSLQMPKVVDIPGGIRINVTGGPAINFSFPQLQFARDITLQGNIDSVDLPRLNTTQNINVTSTGRLNCTDFVARVVNSTSLYHPQNDTMRCVSPEANIVTFRVLEKKSGGSILEAGRRGTLLWVALVGFMVVAL